jgi:hypothetical protein
MKLGRILLGAAAVAAIAVAYRDFRGQRWLLPTMGGDDEDDLLDEMEADEAVEEEPVLGYDGMDRDTVVDWLRDATLDEATLLRMERYEKAHENREPVLEVIADQLTAFG